MSGLWENRKRASYVTMQGVLLCLCIASMSPQRTLAWGSDDTACMGDPTRVGPGLCSTHFFITNKAVAYLRQNGLLSHWPLEYYLWYVNYGDWYADHTPLPCVWDLFSFIPVFHDCCDAIHHYGRTDSLEFYIPGDFFRVLNAVTAHPGDFAAPEYAQALYDIATKFWPGGEPAPDIHDLPYKEDGGSYTIDVAEGWTDFFNPVDFTVDVIGVFAGGTHWLGPTVLGAEPFAMKIKAKQEECWATIDFCHTLGIPIESLGSPIVDWPYQWPGWDPHQIDTNMKKSLFYLGWAIHLVEDLSVPYHALNISNLDHRDFETDANALVEGGAMNHLPNNRDITVCCTMGGYNFCLPFPARPDFFDNSLSVREFAETSAALSVNAQYFPIDLVLPPTIMWDAQIEIDLNTAIKLTAGVIYKFFSEMELPKDAFDAVSSNDSLATAAAIGLGTHEGLTLHDLLDEDYYQVTVPGGCEDVQMIVRYDKADYSGMRLRADLLWIDPNENYGFMQRKPFHETADGLICGRTLAPAKGRLCYIHVYSADRLCPFDYQLVVEPQQGDLDDRYESNDCLSDAAPIDFANSGGGIPGGGIPGGGIPGGEPGDKLKDGNDVPPGDGHGKFVPPDMWCDAEAGLSIHNCSDVDYYKCDGAGFSVTASITFDPNIGELELYLDGVKATEVTVSDDGTWKTLFITGCGLSPSFVRVQGDKNSYTMCLSRFPAPNCLGGLVGLWRLDETSGTVASDSSGNGHHGALMGNPQWLSECHGGALEFEGVGDYVLVPGIEGSDLQQFTIAAWAEPISIPNDRIGGALVSIRSPQDYVASLYCGAGRRLHFRVVNNGQSVDVSGEGVLAGRVFHHCAITYDGTVLRLFLDGTEIGSSSADGALPLDSQRQYDIWFSSPVEPLDHRDERLDDVRIYNRALSSAEIAQIAQSATP